MLIAISITGIQVYVEYDSQKNSLKESLVNTQKIFNSTIYNAIWNLDEEQISSTAKAIISHNSIIGIYINDKNNQVIKQIGIISNDFEQSNKFLFDKENVTYKPNLISHNFSVVNQNDSNDVLATVTFYADKSYIYNKISTAIGTILISAFLKSLVLLLLFLYFSEKLISQTLRELTAAINITNTNKFKPVKKDNLSIHGNNEITLLVDSYNAMQERLRNSKIQNDLKDKTINDKLALIDKYVISSSTDLEGKITQASKAFYRISGYTPQEIIGKSHNILKHPDMPNSLFKEIWNNLTNGKAWKGEIKNKRKDGSYYWVSTNIFPNYNEKNNIVGYTAIRYNITDKKIMEELSLTDALTGAFNRRYFNQICPKLLNIAKRKNELISFLMIDIDYFKLYNDTYGHKEGDKALISITKAISSQLKRANDCFFRFGGEEFVAFYKPKTKEESLKTA